MASFCFMLGFLYSLTHPLRGWGIMVDERSTKTADKAARYLAASRLCYSYPELLRLPVEGVLCSGLPVHFPCGSPLVLL